MDPKQLEDFNFHRFDNPSSWLDREKKAVQLYDKIFLGKPPTEELYGYKKHNIQVTDRIKEEFKKREPAFTSGCPVLRTYDRNHQVSDGPLEPFRSDPFHFPNTVGSTNKCHWGDWRSGNRNPEFIKPTLLRPLDKELYDAVSEEDVAALYKKQHFGVSKPMDPTCAEILFGPEIEVLGGKRTRQLRDEQDKRTEEEHLARMRQIKKDSEEWTAKRKLAHSQSSPAVQYQSQVQKRREQPAYRVPVYSATDGNSEHYRMSGGRHAHNGFAGTYSASHGGGSGIAQLAIVAPPVSASPWTG